MSIILFVVVLVGAVPVRAASPNYAEAWETLGGARWNGYVQIQASFNDNGRNARRGEHRFRREAGPALDTGWRPTPEASSRSDSRIHSHQMAVWDSPLWGAAEVTNYGWRFFWF